MKNVVRIGLASDHAGFELKSKVKAALAGDGYEVEDFGTHSLSSTDYADYIHPLAKKVNDTAGYLGIAICGSGEGVCMTANKYSHVRAGLVWNTEVAGLIRAHNDANMLCLPARFISEEEALSFIKIFLQTDFEGGRHQTRIDKIPQIL